MSRYLPWLTEQSNNTPSGSSTAAPIDLTNTKDELSMMDESDASFAASQSTDNSMDIDEEAIRIGADDLDIPGSPTASITPLNYEQIEREQHSEARLPLFGPEPASEMSTSDSR